MSRTATNTGRHLGSALGVLGVAGLVVAFAARPSPARAATSQDWSPFVLVTGLLLIGLVAADDGLFDAAGHHLARLGRNGLSLFIGASLLVGVVTAVLNLDTSVAFLTPVLIATARSRRIDEAPLLYGCLLLSNAGSLFLPGSNLTNLIVVGNRHLSGAGFLSHMWAPALAALVVTAAVIAGFQRRTLLTGSPELAAAPTATIGVGLAAVVLAVVLVIALQAPALPVAAVGIVAAGSRLAIGKTDLRQVAETLGAPVMVGLFGLAVALGTLGRIWSGPINLLSHLDAWATAGVAAACSVLVNNLPAASLLASRSSAHPFGLLIGLNLGPNLFVTGSLAWVLWLRVARRSGARPSVATASRIGMVAVPLSMVAALGVLVVSGNQ